MRRLVLILISSLMVLSGCQSTASNDLLEAELRARNDDLRQAKCDLERSQAYNEYLQRELRNRLRHGPGPHTAAASTSTVIQKITLGRQTGGYEKDGMPGDEMLQVVIEPRDMDGHSVKASGSVEVQALTVAKEGIKQPLCSWIVRQNDLGRYWRSGLLSTGYFLQLPWKKWPCTRNVRVVVRFLSADQRLFEADKDVTVRLIPDVLKKAVPPPKIEKVPAEVEVPAGPPPVPELPAPSKVWEAPPEMVPMPLKSEPESSAIEEWIPPPISTTIITAPPIP